MAGVLTQQQVHAAMAEHPHWTAHEGALTRAVQAPDFMAGIRLVGDVAEVAEEMNHHPDVDIRWTTVKFSLTTHSEGGVTEHDVTLAGRIDEIVDRMG
ncbi:MAG: 4a-hydroxytetrahydrobiopterin dehydratase [Propionibacteriales bacterium]|nr:4a-hydroxytetrahydrobiopterin dehydratase [Propionibacteriales bacterium]